MASFATSSLQCVMNQLSNHDHSRFLTRTNHKVGRAANLGTQAASKVNKGIMKEAVVIQMTWPGARHCIMEMKQVLRIYGSG